ncbi:neuroblast differentiation-associated protein AHNAK isoform X1 [Xiphophorus hellerii]|uniref:neuroblast differentiation-associated protein AHNAK isoform X1 n=1 Tax=Xiphophorus hellerii TaxID=8084 RepID=UPI0013B38E7D|nr:neuroblast differentiation-associated protein AHNAK-like isoform X1 [Xiphophorus hellerii]
MCDCFHLALPNWHAAPSGTAGRRLRAPEPATQDDSICEEPTQFAEGERPRPQGSSPVQEYPEAAKYADKECEEHDADHKAGSGHKGKKSGLGSIFERTSTPKMSKLKEAPSPEGGVIVNTAQDGCAEGLVYGGGGKEGIFIKKVVPESPASKSLKVKEGDQILSATVYFDNMSYEDAIQILEHAQAYKLKLCLKRQPDFTETEPTIDSDVIPEEEVSSTEMREQGKTRRRGDARISWPKFPSFGKGRKSRFTRSHSSSEADEQRKLELSPTTSDTESPIKSQDALKGKKKHKIKLSGLKRRGRISSSEDQDTDVPTSGQMSSDVQQKQESDTLSPEFPEYPIAETPEINEQAGEAMESDPVQHKVELVSVDATLKTTDQTVVLGDEEGQSGAPKSPDEKKKKKERSELKMKILGKDKSHKKDAKAKSSPKRLKTLGASVDTEDLPEAGKSAAISSSESKTRLMGDQSTVGIDNKSQGGESSKLISSKFITSQIILPKVELDISLRKSPKKGDDKTQKGKETKQKQSKKSSPKDKQLELDMSNVANAEEMQTVNDQEPTTTTGRVSTTQLPKREDIEIPGMEDMSVKTTVADYKKRNKESQAETVQMSIDVHSVKEAVSKLPGFKLPQLDISGVPIPEEITVIDANAQRISVKTPTKVAKPKQEEHLTRSDTTASSEISKTIFLTDNRFDFKKSQMEDATSPTKCKSEEEAKEKEFDTTNGKAATKEELKTSTRPKITMPSFGMSAKSRRLPYIGIDMQKPSFIQEKELELTTETRKDERQTGEVICKVKIPELDGIEYIDSMDESVKKDGVLTNFNVSTDTKTILAISLESKETSDKPEDERNKLSKVRISPSGKPSGKEDISDEGMTKPLDRDGKSTFKWPNLDISVPKIKGTTVDINTSKKDAAHTVAQAEGGQIPGGPESDTVLKSSDVPKEMAEAENPQVEIKPTETEGEFDWEASKCTKFGIKTPKIKGPEFDLSLSKKEAHGKAAGKLPEASKAEVSPGKGNVYFLKQKMQLEKPGEVKPLQSKGEHVQGGKIKIPKFGVKTTKLAGPEISLSKKDAEVTLPEAKPEIKLTGTGTGTDVNKDSVRSEEQKGMEKSDVKIKTLQKEGEAKGHGHKIKMPQLGIALPKVTTHESDLSLSKKGKDLTLPEVKGKIKDLDIEGTGSSTKLDVRAPGIKVETKDVEGSLSKFKMSPFKISRFGAATPNLSGEVSEASETHTLEDGPGTDVTIPDSDVKIKASEIDGRASKFKIPKFGISLPKLKGSETDTTQSQKANVDVTLFKGDTEIKLTDAEHEEPGIRLKGKFPQIGVQQDVEYSASKPEIPVPFSDAKAEVKLLQVDGEKINFSSPVVLNETPELEIPTTKAEHHLAGQEEKMKLSKIGIKMPKIKGPEFQLGLSSKDTDVMETEGKVDNKTKVEVPVPTDVSLGKAEILISSGKVEVGKPEVQTQPTVEGQGGKFKMPKFGITMPKVKGPEAKKEVEMKLTETKTDIKIPDANFEAPDVEQSPSKFNMPTFKLPKLGLGTSDKNVEGDDIDKDIPDEVLAVTIVAPSSDLSNIDVDTHLFESKTEVALSSDDVNKYSIEVEATAPQIKVPKKEKEGSPSKFKMPTFKLPKFGLSVQSSTEKEPPLDKDLKTGQGQITTSGEILSTSLEAPRIDVKAPSVALKTTGTESEGRGRKFKLPSLGFSASQTKGPDTDITLPTTEVDITLPTTEVDVTAPEVKAEIQLPEEKFNKSFEVEAKAPEFKGTRKETEGSPSKFKMPTFKMPKFGLSGQSSTAEVPPLDKDLKTGEGEITTSGEILVGRLEAPRIDVKAPSVALEITGTESEGRGRKFKLPSLGFSASQTKGPHTDIILRTTDVDISLPTTDVDISLPTTDVDISLPTTDVHVTAPEVKAEIQLPEEKFNKSFEVEAKAPEFKSTRKETEGSPSKFKMPTFKMPKFGLSSQSSTAEVPPLDKDLKTGEGEITTSGEILVGSLEAPRIDVKAPSVALETTGTESEGRGRKFKLPSLGFSASQTKGPDTDIILPTTEVDINLPTTEVDVTAPEVKAEIQLPEEKFNKSFEVEAKAPEFKGTRKETEGSPSKFKMPTFKMPKFGLSGQSSTAELPSLDKDLKTGEGEITTSGEILVGSLEAPRIDVKAPSVALETTGTESEGRGRKFKLPSLGFSASQTKGPDTDIILPTTEVDISLPSTEVDVTAPEVKAEIQLPEEKFNKSFEVEAKAPEFKSTRKETEGSPSKFKMPTFKMPKFGLSSQSSTAEVPPLDKDLKTGEGEITTSGEILVGSLEAPRIDVKAPSVALETTGTESEGRGRKFKLPSLGFSASQTKGPDTDIILPTTEVDISLPTTEVDVTAPEVKAEIQLPEEKFNKSFEVEAKAPEFKGTRKETEGSPSKFKMPTFKMPKFGLSGQSSTAELPSLDKDLKTGEGEITTSGEILVGSLEAPRIDVKAPSVALETTGTESEGRGRKFKLPSLGFSASQTKGPDTDIILPTTEVDISLPTTEVDVTAPEVKAEIQLPEEKFNKSFEVEAKAPEFKGTRKETEGSPSKFKMPTFKMPKFGLSGQSSTAELPSLDKDLKTGEGEITTSGEILVGSLEAPRIDVKAPSVALETTGTESEGRGRKFKLPSLGFSASQTKGPDTDISLPTTDVDISLPATDVHVTAPEVKAEIQIPEEKLSKSFEVEAKAPEFKGTRKETEGSPSKFKMPTFKMPKFGLSGQSFTAEVPPLDKDLKIPGGEMTMSEEVIVVSTEEPSVEIGDLSIESKKEGSEREGKGKRFKLPSLGFSAIQAKVPDTDFSLKTGVDVTQPEIKAEVKFPDNELKRIETEIETKAPEFQVKAKDIEGSTSKFKMPTFKLPKFGLATQSSTEEVPSFDKDVKIGGGETTGLEEVLTVTTEGPSVEIKGTSVDLRTEGSDLEGKGRKFKLPSLSFSVPQAKEPETDLSLRTDVDVKVPEVKAEIKLPSNKSVEVETKTLETKDTKKSTEGSPSKFKMPNFKLPKFGLATQTSTGEVPPLDEDVKPVKGKITTSEEVIVVTTEAPTIEIKGPLLELKTEGIDREEKGKKFKLPSLGFSASEAKGTGSDLGLSKTEVDVTLPEVKAEVKLPDDENLIKTSTAIEIKGPEIKTVTKDTDGSPSKFKMPAFKLPKFGLTTQSSTEEGSPLEKDEEDGEPKNTVTAIETKTPEITVVSKDTDGSPSKFKMPTFKLPKFGLATQSSNKQVQDVKTVRGESTTLEEVLTVTTEEPSIKIKGPSVDLRSSETDDERKGSKFKLPSLGFSLSQSKGPDTNISLPKADVDVTAPEVKAEVQFSSAKVEQPSVQMDVKSPEIKADINTTSEVKMPKITLPTFGAVTPHVSMEIPKMTKEKRGDVDLHVDTDPVDLNVKEGELKKYEVQSPNAEAKGEDVPTVELEGKVKRLNWTFPSISFSRTGGKAPDVDVNMETPKAGVTSMETKISDVDIKESSAVEATPGPELDPGLKKSKFSLPKFSFSKPSLKEPEVKAELPDHGIEVENYETDMTTEIKLSADEDKNVLTAFEMTTSEAEVKSKTFKMPTLKMPRFGSVSYDVTTETHISDKTAEDDGSQLGEGAAVIIKGPKTDFKSDARKSEQQDQETLNTESDSVVQGSPSKFKLPTFKMPQLGLSRSKLEDESVHFEYENSEDQLEMKTAPKEDLSQKLTLTSFGDILKSIDVDFDVRKVDKVDLDVETSKQSHEPGEATTKHTSAKTKHDTTKSPESSSWFKFPKFGLSSPTEQQKIPDKAEQVKDSSPVGETKDEEVSPTLSVQSSDAFADVSSTITSEPVDPFIPSPTKVTIKYSDESAGAGFEEMHSNIMTSTTRTELITDVPTLPEKVTILSSGVSSSSEDTVRLMSGKIHIITSNIQPTPESQHAKILSAVQVQSGEGFALQSEGDDAPLWTVQDAQSATRTVKHLVQETTTERSENKETVVITKQITHIFGPTEPISGETASSIQRLKDSVHTEKMRFFDEAEK